MEQKRNGNNVDTGQRGGLILSCLQLLCAICVFMFINPYIFQSIQKKDIFDGFIKELSGKAYKEVTLENGYHYWASLRVGDKVSAGDRIKVGSSSRIFIKLKSGEDLWISKNSVVQLREKYRDKHIKVEQGEAIVNFFKGSRLLLENGDIIVAKKSSQVKLRSLASDRSFETMNGEIKVYNRQDDVFENLLTLPTKTEVASSIKLAATQSTKRLKSRFSPQNKWYIELSPVKSFSDKDLFRKEINGSEDVNLFVKKSMKYWRIIEESVLGETLQYSGVGSLPYLDRSKYVNFPVLKTIGQMNLKRSVGFRWESPNQDLRWTLEISRGESFNDVEYRVLLGDEQSYTTSLPKGIWFWRVMGRRVFTDTIYESPTGQIEVSETSALRFPASIMKRLARAPYKIKMEYYFPQDRTRIEWAFGKKSSRYGLRLVCKKKKGLRARSSKNKVYMDLKSFVGCQFKVKSIDKRSLSKWSYPVTIRREYVTESENLY